jgi:hypothetical protein
MVCAWHADNPRGGNASSARRSPRDTTTLGHGRAP